MIDISLSLKQISYIFFNIFVFFYRSRLFVILKYYWLSKIIILLIFKTYQWWWWPLWNKIKHQQTSIGCHLHLHSHPNLLSPSSTRGYSRSSEKRKWSWNWRKFEFDFWSHHRCEFDGLVPLIRAMLCPSNFHESEPPLLS